MSVAVRRGLVCFLVMIKHKRFYFDDYSHATNKSDTALSMRLCTTYTAFVVALFHFDFNPRYIDYSHFRQLPSNQRITAILVAHEIRLTLGDTPNEFFQAA